MKTFNINKNIYLNYIEMKKLKTTVVGMYIKRPLLDEEAALNAVLSYVLKRGTKKYPKTSDISKKLDDLYGAKLNSGIIKNGDNQVIFFDCETISDKYAPGKEKTVGGLLELLSEVVFSPYTTDGVFSGEYVEREKTTVKDRIASIINDKRSYAQKRCIEIMCENDPFSTDKFGKTEDVEKINPKMLYEHYKKIITSSRIDIFVCGEADCDQLVQNFKKCISEFEFSEYGNSQTNIIKACDEVKRVTEHMEVTQGKLSLGFNTGISVKDSEYPALVVFNSIFGAGTHSKLFNNVREKLSLAYYASSSINKYKGIMTVNAGIEFDKFQKTYDETIYQLDELKKGNITDDEFNFSISTIINALDSYYDDQRAMQLFALDGIYTDTDTDIENYKKKILSVTKEDVVKIGDKIKENTVYFLAGKE